jgi:hypothetical protein
LCAACGHIQETDGDRRYDRRYSANSQQELPGEAQVLHNLLSHDCIDSFLKI